MYRRVLPTCVTLIGLFAAAVFAGSAPESSPAQPDFAFIHISDIHVGPHLTRTGPPEAVNGAKTIDWVCHESAKPQTLEPFGVTTPPPAFGIATGDLTEYGVIDDTWAQFEAAFKNLPFPLHVAPGNHDNTWVAMYAILRAKYGGENHSFDKFGCHFVCLSSASPQEPVPSIDGKTRSWLKNDLDKLAPATPVFLALHHPPNSDEFANPAEYDTFINLIRDYNVVLILYGHGHGVNHADLDGIDGVMGGSTFGKTAGYSVVSVQDGRLRVAYRRHREPAATTAPATEKEWTKLLDKPLRRELPRRLLRIDSPADGETVRGDTLEIRVAMADATAPTTAASLAVHIDGKKTTAEWSTAKPGEAVGRVRLEGLQQGAHLLTLRLEGGDKMRDLRTRTFLIGDGPARVVWRKQLPAAVKAGPVPAGSFVVIACTDGIVTALDRTTGEPAWTFTTGAEILGTPAWSEEMIAGPASSLGDSKAADPAWAGHVLVLGSGDGRVYAVNGQGKKLWIYEAGAPVYSPPLIEGKNVYVGDNSGRLHALNLTDGTRQWMFERADFSIEQKPGRWDDRIVFGAWDGYLYAVGRADGKQQWKVLGLKSSDGKGSRYYAPADCGPVPIADSLFVCDRGYLLGLFAADGALRRKIDENVAAIAPTADGQGLLIRGTADRVCRLDAEGNKVWETKVPAGRFPVPPTAVGKSVYVCSNRGLLSVLNADDGKVRWSYQATPGFYVMAPVAVDADGICYVAGMDGTVTALRGE